MSYFTLLTIAKPSLYQDANGNHDDGHIIASKVSEYINAIQAYANCSDDDSLRALQQNDITIYLQYVEVVLWIFILLIRYLVF